MENRQMNTGELVAMRVNDLKEHPMNEYLFGNIEGEKWQEFLESVRQNGIINPLIITQNKVIISGHQRARACKELGIDSVKCCIVDFEGEDDALKALIDSNIKQRGVINFGSVRLGRLVCTLEELYGVSDRRGGAPRGNAQSKGEIRTKTDLREYLQISRDKADIAKKIAGLPDEAAQFIENKSICVTAGELIAKLTADEQIALFKSLDVTQKYTQAQIEKAIREQYPNAEQVDELQKRLVDEQAAASQTELNLRAKIQDVTQKERTTYETLQAERRSHRAEVSDYERRMESTERLLEESQNAQNDADTLLICNQLEGLSSCLKDVADRETALQGDYTRRARAALERAKNVIAKVEARLNGSGEPETNIRTDERQNKGRYNNG